MHHQSGDAVLLPGVQLHHLLPVGGHLLQSVVAAEIHQIKNIFLEATTAKARSSLEELGADSAIAANRLGHLPHVGTGGLTEGGDASGVEIHHRDADLGTAIGDHRHGGTAHIAGTNTADREYLTGHL